MPTDNIRNNNEPLTEVNSLRTSRRPSSLHRRKSKIAGRTVLYIPPQERLYAALAFTMQIIILALLIAAATTDVFKVDGTKAIKSGADLKTVATGLGVSITEGSKPFCYSLWGARRCGTTAFNVQKWYTERGIGRRGFPSPVTYTMMVGAAAFSVLAACYSFINLVGIAIVVYLQDYTAVLCAWSFSVWITILISWALSVGVYARAMTTMNSSTIPGRKVHIKDYCNFSTSFALTMTAFGLHAFQFSFTVVYVRMFEKRMKSMVTEQKQLNAAPIDQVQQEFVE
ncbi:Amastin surface glycoprotein [Novymonas esmeraldas]|uniref:Amastin surface glycoprotein n=1 Tax=Novymonas esmeraldas TaxID=1808958 RepID=A0AAW0ETZ3_9TRYP